MTKKYELRATYGDMKSRKVADNLTADQLQERKQDLRSRRKTGSSTFYTAREKG